MILLISMTSMLEVHAEIETIPVLINSDFGQKLKTEKTISLVVLNLMGPDIFKRVEKDGITSRDYPTRIAVNGVDLFTGVIEYTSIGGPQKWIRFKTKDRYLRLEIDFTDIDRSYSGVLDMKKNTIIEMSLSDENLSIETFRGRRTYE